MGSKTGISWTSSTNPETGEVTPGSTWNMIVGCSHVSAGCERCYAETLALRWGWTPKPWTKPNAKENITLKPEKLDLPLRWTKPRKIFVNSLSDLFHEEVPDEFILQVWDVMRLSRNGYWPEKNRWVATHTFQILTKRPERMLDFTTRLRFGDPRGLYLAEHANGPGYCPVLPNVWLGTSVEAQREADLRIPILVQTPAAVRFLSCEPLLGPVSLRKWLPNEWEYADRERAKLHGWPAPICPINWVIVGGESGSGYREMDLDWARQLRNECRAAHVPFFFKQSSGPRPGMDATLDGVEWHQFPEVINVSNSEG